MDFYSVLGIQPKATPEEIKKAYRKLAREHHPDHNPGDADATKRFIKIKEAYDFLCGNVTKTHFIPKSPPKKEAPKPKPPRVYRDFKIFDAPPPTHDLWGQPLSALQRAEWSRDNATDVEKIHNLKKQPKDFIDVYKYENGSSPDIRG
jgi:hypothetical protein